jgi:ribosomal protein L11 methyltransferase
VLLKLLLELGIKEPVYSIVRLPDKNWNEIWESNYEPVTIGKCRIRAPFHTPDSNFFPELVIEPKMSFGTGHHATTSLMVTEMLCTDFKNKIVLDAGCGTGILAILAEKLGASQVTAIDIDEWSYRNSHENILLNKCNKIQLLHGDLGTMDGQTFDVVLANINLNIHLKNLAIYSKLCKKDGSLLISGILSTDIQPLNNETKKHGFSFIISSIHENWGLIRYLKV